MTAYLQLCDEILQGQWQEEMDWENMNTRNEAAEEPILPNDRAFLKNEWRKCFCHHQRKEKPTIFAGKSDLKSVFRILGLSVSSWKWLVMKAQNPVTGEWVYFVDKCLPFGSSISCAHFQWFSDALCHLIEYRLKVNKRVTNYLDDFLFIARTIRMCNYMIDSFLKLCHELGVPVSMEKIEWAAKFMVFLGILLDGVNHTLSVPIEKRESAIQLIQEILKMKKVMVKKLQKLCGYLNFLCKAIAPGRAFVCRMYAKYSTIINLDGAPRRAYDFKLKQNHHVRIDQEFRMDCAMWLDFLSGSIDNVVNRPMTDFKSGKPEEVWFYSDASASERHGGFGVVFGNH